MYLIKNLYFALATAITLKISSSKPINFKECIWLELFVTGLVIVHLSQFLTITFIFMRFGRLLYFSTKIYGLIKAY